MSSLLRFDCVYLSLWVCLGGRLVSWRVIWVFWWWFVCWYFVWIFNSVGICFSF